MWEEGSPLTKVIDHKVFQYNRRGDTWSTLPRCPVRLFGMAHFMGRIITVGGIDLQDSLSNRVHSIAEGSQQWEEFVSPMPTSRCYLSVATTSVAIIAAGGDTSFAASVAYSSAVEVYSSDTSQWHTADPLPIPCAWKCHQSSSMIPATYWVVEIKVRVLSTTVGVPLFSLWSIKESLGLPVGQSGTTSHPLHSTASTAACLSGSLVAVGGRNDDNTRSAAVYGFVNNSWVRLSNGDLLSPRSACTTAQLSPLEVIVIGGYDEQKQRSKTVFIGTLHL